MPFCIKWISALPNYGFVYSLSVRGITEVGMTKKKLFFFFFGKGLVYAPCIWIFPVVGVDDQ